MDRLPSSLLLGIPAVLVVAEEGSATRAAARLKTTPATVLRHIEGVESTLGVRLFDRLPTGLASTSALAAIMPWVEQCAASVDGMLRDVASLDSAPSGIVRVATPPTLAGHLLVPALPRLRDRYPNLTIAFASSTRVVDLGQREADLAIRVVKPTEGDLVLHKLTDYRMVVACTPELAARVGGDIAALPWVSWDSSMAHIPEARWLAVEFPRARIAMMGSELTTLLRAARAGVGALLVAEPTAAMEGGLVRLPIEAHLPAGSLWLVAHRALRHVPRVMVVWEWIAELFGDDEARAALRLPDGE